MGQGQEIIARNLLAAATADGQWLLLQNTHLGLAYLSEVQICPFWKSELALHFTCMCIAMLWICCGVYLMWWINKLENSQQF